MRISVLWIGQILLMLFNSATYADVVERRRDQFRRDYGFYLYPIAGQIPGTGKVGGVGVSVLNMRGGDTDFTSYYIRGDIEAKGAVMLDYHILPQRLIFDAGYNDYRTASAAYSRGIASDPAEVIYPRTEGAYLLGQMTLTFDERRYEVYARVLTGRSRLIEILDRNRQAFAGTDTGWNRRPSYSVGGSLDLTDDGVDPRDGIRLEYSGSVPAGANADASTYFVNDYNVTAYLPTRKWDTLVFNLFHSRAHVVSDGLADHALLQQRYGLNCGQYPAGPQRTACESAEANFLDAMLANNRSGTASPLGGTQRLRSFDNGRFHAARALSYGAEYRWNLTDERVPFDFYVAKGVRTGIQLAAFWERGMVAERFSELHKDGRNSYGIGARLILSGVVIRFDVGRGKEGTQSQLFITYPWSMFSVDRPV